MQTIPQWFNKIVQVNETFKFNTDMTVCKIYPMITTIW